jgi:thioredoxin 1
MASVIHVHSESGNWEQEVLNSEIPVLVDFWGDWCGPCKSLAPVLDQLAEELDGRMKVAKAEVTKNKDLASQFGVRSIPALFVLVNGEIKESLVGAMQKEDLVDKLAPFLS